MYVKFDDIEGVYHSEVLHSLNDNPLSTTLLIELSKTLFQTVKVEDLPVVVDSDDMLLFQYGIYDWGDENGEHFSLDITRQLSKPPEYEPYQINLTLIFDPEQFKGIQSYDCWSADFVDPESFFAHIITTDGFKLAEAITPKTYHIQLEQC